MTLGPETGPKDKQEPSVPVLGEQPSVGTAGRPGNLGRLLCTAASCSESVSCSVRPWLGEG